MLVAVKLLASNTLEQPRKHLGGGDELLGQRRHEREQVLEHAENIEDALAVGLFLLVESLEVGNQELEDRVAKLSRLARAAGQKCTHQLVNDLSQG